MTPSKLGEQMRDLAPDKQLEMLQHAKLQPEVLGQLLKDMLPSEREHVLQHLDYWLEASSMEVCRERDRNHKALTRARTRILKLEAVLGTASAVLDAVALFGKRQAPWVDVERTNRQLRRAIVELVAPPPKTKKSTVGVNRVSTQ